MRFKHFRESKLVSGRLLFGLLLIGLPVVSAAGRDDSPGDRRVVQVIAERFHFTPAEIRVQKGEQLEIELLSEDTFHGFYLPDANLNVTIPARRRGSVKVLFNAARRGSYSFECSRPCGAGHTLMRGVIIVE